MIQNNLIAWKNDEWEVEINRENGHIEYFADARQPARASYIADRLELPVVDTDGKLQVEGYSALLIGYSVSGKETYYREWPAFHPTAVEGEFLHEGKHFRILKRFSRHESGSLIVELIVTAIADPLELEELALSTPVSNYYSPWRYDQRFMYDNKVYEHLYPAGTGGYQLIEPLSGRGRILACAPLGGTQFEYASHYPGTIDTTRPGIENHSWPGSSIQFLLAKGYLLRNGYQPLFAGQEAASVVLAGGESADYAIEMQFIENREAIRGWLVSKGEIHVSAAPGMIGPIDTTFEVSAYGEGNLSIKEGSGIVVIGTRSLAGGMVWTIAFAEAGDHAVHIASDTGKAATLSFRITEPLNMLLDRRADFVVDRQVFREPGHALDGAIVPYTVNGFEDMEGEGLYAKEESIWGTGSYEGGITEAMFVAEKNVRFPKPRQVRELDQYINRYVRRYLQNPDTNEVIWWCYGFSTTRSYNYMHVANFYYSMYEVGRLHQLTERAPKDYLMLAYETLMKMFEVARPVDLVAGMMGGQRIFDMLKAFQREDWVEFYFTLLLKVRQQASLLFLDDVPYGSECAYDNTGYECIAFYADFFREEEVIAELADVMKAARGSQPVWWWHGSDIRWWDATIDYAECCHHYTSPLNASALLMLVRNDWLKPTPGLLSSIFSGLLGSTGKIHADGRASMSYSWEQESSNYGDHVCSGDAGLSLFGTLVGLRSFAHIVSQDELTGYLCQVHCPADSGHILVKPLADAGRNLSWHVDETGQSGDIDLNAGRIEELAIARDGSGLRIAIRQYPGLKCDTELAMRVNGRVKQVFVDGRRAGVKRISGQSYSIGLQPSITGSGLTVIEVRIS